MEILVVVVFVGGVVALVRAWDKVSATRSGMDASDGGNGGYYDGGVGGGGHHGGGFDGGGHHGGGFDGGGGFGGGGHH